MIYGGKLLSKQKHIFARLFSSHQIKFDVENSVN